MTSEPLTIYNRLQLIAWKEDHPWESWALDTFQEHDPLRLRILSFIFKDQEILEDDLEELRRHGEAIENKTRAEKAGVFEVAPEPQITCDHMVYIKAMKPRKSSLLFYRVEFFSPKGWSGYFDTTSAQIVEKNTQTSQTKTGQTVIYSRRSY